MNGSVKQRKGGLQVVKVSARGRRYELDEQALASVLLRPDVRHLPVAVVSVAGGYRGGKSFLLDFFLRYLTASSESQNNGEWLGNEQDVLEGFEWRGGGECHTKGIHLWSEPIVVTNKKTGQKVAVLLMDTQGTFDTESDMGDNSTIFALSTLLSSVQVYNLRMNIGEDDLQHLQLFTEYGRLACDSEGRAFQTLLFLIRDWMSPHEHPHGYGGGQTLMDMRLVSKSNQKKQLFEVREYIHSCFENLKCFLMPHPGLIVHEEKFKGLLCDIEVREHIHSCFENLKCFLMPHPGLIVHEEKFKGRLCDISEIFRSSLLELVPSLFDQNNLTPKMINGDKVQAQELLEFFKQYVAVFNSDDLPEATTIFQATVDACIVSALRKARESYEKDMNSHVTADQSVSASMVESWHNAAVENAIALFKKKKKLGSQDKIKTHLEDLEKELGAKLTLCLWQNDNKVRESMTSAKEIYDSQMRANLGDKCENMADICLHAQDLHAYHVAAMELSLAHFRANRTLVPEEEDTCRKELLHDLEQRYKQLCDTNVANNNKAVSEALKMYRASIKDLDRGASCSELKVEHEKQFEVAINTFLSHRNQTTAEAEDPDLDRLKQEIQTYFSDELERANAHHNSWALEVALSAYNSWVSSAWGEASNCFHPLALAELHEEAQAHAVEELVNRKFESENDDYKEKLIATLQERYQQLCSTNEENNNKAVAEALEMYRSCMKNVDSGVGSNEFKTKHEENFQKAIEIFLSHRKRTNMDIEDPDLESLKLNINIDFKEDFQQVNASYNSWAIKVAESAYNSWVASVWQPESGCFHPEGLNRLHELAQKHAIKKFLDGRSEDEEDEYKDKLIENLEARYEELKETNDTNNNELVEQAFDVFKENVNYFPPLFFTPLPILRNNGYAKAKALSFFAEKRLGSTYEPDEYMDTLNSKMAQTLTADLENWANRNQRAS